MGKKIVVRVHSPLIAVCIRLRLGQNLSACGKDAAPRVLRGENLLPAVIAVVDQLLLMSDGIMAGICHHACKYRDKKPGDRKDLFIPLLLRILPGASAFGSAVFSSSF